jgi:nicotinamidase-related amidase
VGDFTKTAVLVIDVQIGLVTGAHREVEVLSAIQQVIDRVRAGQGTVVFIQHCHATYEPLMIGSPQWALHPSLPALPDDIYIEKTASDSFFQTRLDEILKSKNIEHLLVTGLQTEYCVDTTCRSAISKQYDVTLIEDAHTTGDAHISAAETIAHHNAILANLAHPTHSIDVRRSEII